LGLGFGLGLGWLGVGEGKDWWVARGCAMGAGRAQAYGPLIVWRGAQGFVPSVESGACGPNCARPAPIVSAPWRWGLARSVRGGLGLLAVPARGPADCC